MKASHWTTEQIPDQTGRIALVTGSSSGIGYETARVLAAKGAEVVIAVRNAAKGNAAAERIRSSNATANVRVMDLDLADLASVRRFAETFKNSYARLDLLINNAGVMIPPYSKTADGFELQFGTNHLGHFALTGLLLGMLAQTENSRVVNVASGMHKAGRIDFEDLNWEKRPYKAWRGYGDSKIANLYFTYELNRRVKTNGIQIMAVAAHPGWTATELQRHTSLASRLNGIFAQDISMGALPTLRSATDPFVQGGEYYGPGGFMEMRGYPVRVESNKRSHDQAIAAKLWDVSEQLTGVSFALRQTAMRDAPALSASAHFAANAG